MRTAIRRTASIVVGLACFFGINLLRVAKNISETVFTRGSANSNWSLMAEALADTFTSLDDALKTLLPGAQTIKQETKSLTDEQKKAIQRAADVTFDAEFDKEFRSHLAEGPDGKVTGYAVEHTVNGKWGPIQYVIAFTPDGKIADVIALALTERRGRPVKERRFLNQFKGKTTADQIINNRDIKGVAGATVSAREMSNGIRKMVHVFNTLYKT